MFEFTDMAQVEATLEGLAGRDDGPFVVRLPREPGKRESRYMHLFSGEVEASVAQEQIASPVPDDLSDPSPVHGWFSDYRRSLRR